MLEDFLARTRDFSAEPIPRLIGVYLLMKRGRVVYVGQSANLVQRIYAHRRRGGFDEVRWISLDESDLLAYEGAIARALNPPRSKRVSPDTSRDEEIWAVLGLKPDPDRRFERRVQRRNAAIGGRVRRRGMTKKEHAAYCRRWKRWANAEALWSAVQPFLASHSLHTTTVCPDLESVCANRRESISATGQECA